MAARKPVMVLHGTQRPRQRRVEEQVAEGVNLLRPGLRYVTVPLVDEPASWEVFDSYERGTDATVTSTSAVALSGSTAVTVPVPDGVEMVVRVGLVGALELDGTSYTATLSIYDGSADRAAVTIGCPRISVRLGFATEYVVTISSSTTFTPRALVSSGATATIRTPIFTVHAVPQANRYRNVPVTRTYPIHVSDGEGEVLVKGALLSRPAWSVSATDYYRIRLGVARGSRTDWVGSVRSDEVRVPEGERLSLTGTSDINRRLAAGDLVVAEVSTYGTPGSLAGSSVTVALDKSGGA